MFVVTLPQAFRVSLPPLANEFSSVIKDSAYLSISGWMELAGAGFTYQAESYKYHYAEANLVSWMEVALLFFLLTYIVTRTLRAIEDASRVPGLEAAAL
jgi:polar amino acid transport system permease protein